MQKLSNCSSKVGNKVAPYGVNIKSVNGRDGREVIAKQFGSDMIKTADTSSTDFFNIKIF